MIKIEVHCYMNGTGGKPSESVKSDFEKSEMYLENYINWIKWTQSISEFEKHMAYDYDIIV